MTNFPTKIINKSEENYSDSTIVYPIMWKSLIELPPDDFPVWVLNYETLARFHSDMTLRIREGIFNRSEGWRLWGDEYNPIVDVKAWIYKNYSGVPSEYIPKDKKSFFNVFFRRGK
jgi:hypothetical protein